MNLLVAHDWRILVVITQYNYLSRMRYAMAKRVCLLVHNFYNRAVIQAVLRLSAMPVAVFTIRHAAGLPPYGLTDALYVKVTLCIFYRCA